MARQDPGGAPGIGKRWPHKALNFLPAPRLWHYLRRKSGADRFQEPFRLGDALTGCRRILILLPETLQECLVAFPVLRSLMRERSGTDFRFLAEQPLAGFLGALLGAERVIGVRREELYWGEPHFLELQRLTGTFQPDVSINLREFSPALLHFVLRAAQAPLRVQAGGLAPEGFANIALKPAEPPNHLRRYMQVAGLWAAAEAPVPVKWARLSPGSENLKEAQGRLEAEGLRPEATRLFLWQHGHSPREHELLRHAASRTGRPLLILSGSGTLFPGSAPPRDLFPGLPCLQVDSTGLMLGLFASTSGSIGINGPLLHLASLSDTDVEAHFGEADRVWDTSGLNGRLQVVYEGMEREILDGRREGDGR